jgi:hypothetical protein
MRHLRRRSPDGCIDFTLPASAASTARYCASDRYVRMRLTAACALAGGLCVTRNGCALVPSRARGRLPELYDVTLRRWRAKRLGRAGRYNPMLRQEEEDPARGISCSRCHRLLSPYESSGDGALRRPKRKHQLVYRGRRSGGTKSSSSSRLFLVTQVCGELAHRRGVMR